MSKDMIQSQEAMKEMLQRHLLYEVEMLIVALEVDRYGFTSSILNLKKQSVALEIFLLHANNLLEFFYHSAGGDYARAQEFMKEGVAWKDIRPTRTDMMKKLDAQVHEDTRHLSWARIGRRPEDRGWRVDILFYDFQKVIKLFLENVKEEYLDEQLKKLLANLQPVHRPKQKEDVLNITSMTTSATSITKVL